MGANKMSLYKTLDEVGDSYFHHHVMLLNCHSTLHRAVASFSCPF